MSERSSSKPYFAEMDRYCFVLASGKTFKYLYPLQMVLGTYAMVFADQFAMLALLFGAGLWATTWFYQAKGVSITNLALLALILAFVAPVTGGLPAIGGGGADAGTMVVLAIVVLWSAQNLLHVDMMKAASYIVLAWVVGAALLPVF